VAALLDERGLVCTDVGVLPLGTGALDQVAETLVGLAAATGAPVCIAAFSAPVGRARALAELERCADMLNQVDTLLALEFAAYGGLTRLADAVSLCQELGWNRCGVLSRYLALLPDRCPVGCASLTRRRTDRLRARERRSCCPGRGRSARRAVRQAPCWNGSVPLAEFAAVLDEAGYVGPLSTEVLSDDVRNRVPEEGARLLFASLRDCWPRS
jgi:sugar phosphate isomerase/epimerase